MPTYADTQQAADRELTCAHATKELRRLTKSNGAVAYVEQCLRCGQKGQELARARFTPAALDAAPPVDADLERRWWAEVSRYRQALGRERRREAKAAWLDEAHAYYQSRHWQVRSRLVVERDETCQARLPGCTRRAEQAHHLTYDHFQHEPLFDLVGVCRSCHQAITAADRARRGEDWDDAADEEADDGR